MQSRYKASFEFLGPQPRLDDVANKSYEWLSARIPGVQHDFKNAVETPRHAYGTSNIETLVAEQRENSKTWAMRVEHPDNTDGMVRWVTEIVAGGQAGAADRFSCTVMLGTIDGCFVPTKRHPSRPRIVRDLLQFFPAHSGLPLSAAPILLRNDTVGSFLEALSNPLRTRPVVLVGARVVNDKPVIDANPLADWLAGIAHVYVAESRFPMLKLKDALPRWHGVWDGQVRVYWPQFSPANVPWRHPVWSAEEVLRHEQRRKKGFREFLLGRICEVGVCVSVPGEITWGDVEAQRRKMAVALLRDAGDYEKVLKVVEEDAKKKEAENSELGAQVGDLRVLLERTRGQARAWRQAYEEAVKNAPAVMNGESTDSTVAPVEDVADAVERAKQEFAGQISFALNSKSEVENSEFEDPEAVFQALAFLATTYYKARTGAQSCSDFHAAIKSACGWSYEAHQGKTTMGKYEQWYSTIIDGSARIWLEEHIGDGTSKDPRYTIRIGFAWHKPIGKVIVGYIGQHQRTHAT